MNLQLAKGLSLLHLEEAIRTLTIAQREPWQIWLPEDVGPQFFKDTRIVSLLAQAQRVGGFTLIDWIEESSPNRNDERYGYQLLGLAGLMCAKEVLTAKKVPISVDRQTTVTSIVERDGILERQEGRGSSITFCAFDEEAGADIPLPFVGMRERTEFASALIDYRKRYLEKGLSRGYADRQDQLNLRFDDTAEVLDANQDKVLAGFVYELFINSYQHGCLNSEGKTIPGLRFLRLRKHIGTDRQQLVSRAEDFPELQRYLAQVTPETGTAGFYEIAIADQGLGLVDRFLLTRPEFTLAIDTPAKRIELVNRIIAEALSSKRTQSGAGHGLRHAMNAVRELHGFVSLRANNIWAYAAYSPGSDMSLLPVDSPALANIVGTTFNMLFPMR